jgi:hypothetical protein
MSLTKTKGNKEYEKDTNKAIKMSITDSNNQFAVCTQSEI